MPPGCCSLLGPVANFQLIARIWTLQPAERIAGCTCTHKYIKMHLHPPQHCSRQSCSPNPALPAVPGLSPPAGRVGDRGAHGGLGAIHQHGRGARPGLRAAASPPGMNYRAINHARLSSSVLCLPSIRRHKQLCSQQRRQKARQKWVHGDPGD